MLISDWSSDVCASDLREHDRQSRQPRGRRFTTGLMQRRIDRERHGARFPGDIADERHRRTELAERPREAQDCAGDKAGNQTGREQGRERGCKEGEKPGESGYDKKKKENITEKL